MMTNVLEYLDRSAKVYPKKMAFADVEQSCTFEELYHQSRKIGTNLAGYVKPRSPIPVFMEKSVETVEVFMGAVYAGCFYVMLDTKQPGARLQQILQILDSEILVTSMKYKKELEKLDFQGTILWLEELLQVEEDEKLLALIQEQATDTDPLYGIFTSGSTGIPKGVVVGHRSVIDFIDCFTELFDITSKDVLGNQAPFDFDVSVKDIYSGLKTGATVQIIPKQYFSFPQKLLDFLIEREVTTLVWAVSALCIISTLNGFTYKVPEKIKKILFSGEVMPIKHLNIWRSYLPDTMFVNIYGPTEITCNCTYYIVNRVFSPGEVLPIGKPFPNEKVFLLDEKNQLVTEAGINGEICVSGSALALGYYRNPEQTEKVFVQNPLNNCYLERIYRTGDLAYYNENRELCFATRKDFQIKHMGHRIELGEIETAMDKIPELSRCLCVYDQEKNKILAFYEGELERKEICRALTVSLPNFMIPNIFVKVEKMPLTSNGKIDRKKLMADYKEGK